MTQISSNSMEDFFLLSKFFLVPRPGLLLMKEISICLGPIHLTVKQQDLPNMFKNDTPVLHTEGCKAFLCFSPVLTSLIKLKSNEVASY
jgi:hypothetical protein